MSIMGRLVSYMAKKKRKEIDHVLNHPVEMMEGTLKTILRQHRDTVYGKKFGFEKIGSPEKYAECVPLSDITSMKPYHDAIRKNPDGGILTSDPVIYYLQTSGSTGVPKRLPTTKRGIKAVSKGTMLSWMGFMNAGEDHEKIIDGSLITFGASGCMDYIGEVPVGYATGVYSRYQNPLFQRLIKPGQDVYDISDMDEKMAIYAKLLVQHNVTGLQGITTLWLNLVRRMQNEYGPWLLDEFKGTEHEKRLRGALNDSGRIDVAELWPDLKLLLTTGVNTEPYREWIQKTLPDAVLWEMYGASEGYFGGQLVPDSRGVQLSPHICYYEFIPEREVESEEPIVVPLSETKKGQRYEMVVTNCGGYYRYRLGDLITMSDTDPYTLSNIGRKGRITNLSGEKISDAHVQKAMSAACEELSAEVMDYTCVASVEEGLGYYTIAAQFNNDVEPVSFILAYEQAMKNLNEEFRVVRETGALGATRLMKLDRSPYEIHAKRTHIQAKPQILTSDKSVLEVAEAST